VIHRMHVAASMTIMENLFALSPQTNKTFKMPNKTKHREKKVLIARIATTNSVALASMYEYHFHALGTKKCHIPKPIETILPTVTKILASRFKAIPPRVSQARPTACASAVWPAVQDLVHYTYNFIEDHTNEDPSRRPNPLQARVGRFS
jgi:hypothetical protein